MARVLVTRRLPGGLDPLVEAGHEIIQPEDTRPKVIRALEVLQNKREKNPPKKHGNIPL